MECPCRVRPEEDTEEMRLLPMIHPHELLNYLYDSGRLQISKEDIQCLGSDIDICFFNLMIIWV